LTHPARRDIVGAMSETVVIDQRFRGPPDSANGGYTCALAAEWIDGPAEVTLRSPPPLGKPLSVECTDGNVTLSNDGVLIAEAQPTTVAVEAPAPVSLEEARRAAARYPWRDRHPYPTCFVCGPERDAGDGLCIFPGPVDGQSVYAAPWTPEPSLADDEGNVRDEFVWGALDCPSGIVTDLFGSVGLILLGRLAADLRHPVQAGSPYVVQAWPVSRDGRKLNTASALFSQDGELCAVAPAGWIELPAKASAG
jgi:hypothetical protein